MNQNSSDEWRVVAKRLDDDEWFAESEQAPGCWGTGSSAQVAIDDFFDALPDWLRIKASR